MHRKTSLHNLSQLLAIGVLCIRKVPPIILPSGCLNRPKHWTQVARSGISLRVWIRSAACTTTIWPSKAWDIDLPFPFAGGSSVKSTYSSASIFSNSFFDRAGSPLPRDEEVSSFVPCWPSAMASPLLLRISPWPLGLLFSLASCHFD